MKRKSMKTDRVNDKQSERGYALVGLMGVMLFALILTTVAAPSIKYESQREREEEMLWRGHQIQKALREFSLAAGRNQNRRFPTELNELVEGISDGIKKVRFLRPSALCDPMTPCEPGESNWQLVYPGDPLAKELFDALASMQQQQDGIRIQVPGELATFARMAAVSLPGQESSEPSDNSTPPATAPGQLPGFDPSGKRPIIGVVSRKSDQMFRSYYGIDQYDHALFFPGVPVVAGGFNREALIGVGRIGRGGMQQPGAGGGIGTGSRPPTGTPGSTPGGVPNNPTFPGQTQR
jgi:type II secretory pathway pseudopilin PulG